MDKFKSIGKAYIIAVVVTFGFLRRVIKRLSLNSVGSQELHDLINTSYFRSRHERLLRDCMGDHQGQLQLPPEEEG